jgi:small subunit ribosomal protein S6e
MKLNIANPKKSETYSVEIDEKTSLSFLDKTIKSEVDLSFISPGLKGVITGGSDKQGFPMYPNLEGEGRKKLLLKGGVGYNPKKKGERQRKRVASKLVIQNTQQLNIKITQGDTKVLEEKYKKVKEDKKEE